MNKKITIFTPTYNRAYILPQLYKSLLNQTNKDFCWLIVDDGSLDETENIVKGWQKENKILIKYIRQENAGKMQAHNTGVISCNTKFFICVDSDDYLCAHAIELLAASADKIDQNDKVVGTIFYRGKSETEPLTEYRFPNKKTIKMIDLYEGGFYGDTSLLFKTDILRNYLFPKIEGEKFIPEEYLYLQLDNTYDYSLEPQVIIVCEYLNDGYTKNALMLMVNNIKGVSLTLDFKIGVSKKFKNKCLNMIRYIGFTKLARYKSAYKNSHHKFLYFVLYFFGLMYYLKKKRLLNGKAN